MSIFTPIDAPKNDMKQSTSYYNNFSKYVLANTMQEPKRIEPAFTYEQYVSQSGKLQPPNNQHNTEIEKYKLGELKSVAKHYKLPVSGNKIVLVGRICRFFLETNSAICIQKHFRGNMVRLSLRLRGEGYVDRSVCVNECDFYTLDPLRDISKIHFFSYKDAKGFVYGFDMFSLMTLLKKTAKIINPYNREQIPFEICGSLLGLHKISRILFPHIFVEENAFVLVEPKRHRARAIVVNTSYNIANTVETANHILPPPISIYEEPVQFSTQNSPETSVLNTITEVRTHPIDVRIRELFMEINLLGNYAESRWFLDLDRLRLARFYQFYHDWWNTRSRLPISVRNKICILGEPFVDIRLVYLYPTTEFDEYREACIRLMEMMVYGGIDIEYRKLGAMQLLTILTIVSIPARNAMPWLYESVLL